jgi:hypothetical protein
MGMQDPLTEQRLDSTAEIRAFMRLAFASAALNAALELGLFPELADRAAHGGGRRRAVGPPALSLPVLAGAADRPGPPRAAGRCVRRLAQGPRRHPRRLQPADVGAARAGGERALGRRPGPGDPHHAPESVWAAQGKAVPNYVETMLASRERARRFTRMLLELHAPLAEKLADALDLSGASRMMDLGGGSGVMSHALLRRHPQLSSLVVDIAPVCDAGRAIADELALADRIGFHPADFLHDALPGGFDVILECDIAIHGRVALLEAPRFARPRRPAHHRRLVPRPGR